MDSSPAAQDLFDIWGKVNDVRQNFIVFPRAKDPPEVGTSPCHLLIIFVTLTVLVPSPGSLLWRPHYQDDPFSSVDTKTEFLHQWQS